MVALVGLTGAGKTTLVSLIPRFYDPTAGRVLIDGIDTRQYRVRELREKISIVLQDPVLFSGTIADNLRYGRLDATPQEIEDAARAARARLHRAAVEGVRHRDRGSRRRIVRRRAPAPERGARHPEERADSDPRRADLVARCDLGRDCLRGPPAAPRGPYDDRDRAPAVDGARRGSDSRPRRRQDCRAGAARRAAEEQPALPPDVRAPVGRQVARRSGDRRRTDRGHEDFSYRTTITPP